mgnify:CR=1 FL=1
MTRIIWRKAHPVHLPDRAGTKPHQELFAAYQTDQINREIAEDLARELERDFREASR